MLSIILFLHKAIFSLFFGVSGQGKEQGIIYCFFLLINDINSASAFIHDITLCMQTLWDSRNKYKLNKYDIET